MSERHRPPTIDHQFRTWFFVMPEQERTALAVANPIYAFTPEQLINEVNGQSPLFRHLRQATIGVARMAHVPTVKWLQEEIERSLRIRGGRIEEEMALEDPTLSPSSKALAVKQTFAGGLLTLPGVVEVGLEQTPEGRSYIPLYLQTEDLRDRLPLSLEGIPTKFEVIKIFRAGAV